MVTSALEKAKPVPTPAPVEAKAERHAAPVAAAAPPPPPIPFAEPEPEPQEDSAMFGAGPGVLNLGEDQAAEGFSGRFETTTQKAEEDESEAEGGESETAWRRRRADVDYGAPMGSPDLMDAVEERAAESPGAALDAHRASSESSAEGEIAAEPTRKKPVAASPAEWLEMMSAPPATEPAMPGSSSAARASEPVETTAAPAVDSQPGAPSCERDEVAPSLVEDSPNAVESDAPEHVATWHPGSSALEEVAAAIQNAHPSAPPFEPVREAVEEPPQVSQASSAWNADASEPEPSEKSHSGRERPAAPSTPEPEPPREERWWQSPPPVFEPATSTAEIASANPADSAIRETAADTPAEPELLVAPAARVPIPMPEPQVAPEGREAEPVSSAEGLLPTVAHAESDPLTAYAVSEPPAFYPEEALAEEPATVEEPASYVNSFPSPHVADPAVVDAVVSRLLEKLEPHLHEIFSQEVLRPLVENMLHHDEVEKKS
jgi:hypothetical protein